MKKDIPCVIDDEDFLQRLEQVRYAQPVAELLNLPPVDLAAFGFSNSMQMPEQHHIGIHFLDAQQRPVMEIHALGHTNFTHRPAATGYKPKHLSVFAGDPQRCEQERVESGYTSKPGPVFPLGMPAERASKLQRLQQYMAASERYPLAYSTPLSVITSMFRHFRDNADSLLSTELRACPKAQWRRKYLCGGFLRLPARAQAKLISVAKGRRIDALGYNSGSAAGDIGDILGIPVRGHYSPQAAPGIENPVLPWLLHLPPLQHAVSTDMPAPLAFAA